VYRVATTKLEYGNVSLEEAARLLEIDEHDLCWATEEHGFCGTEYFTCFEHVPLANSPSLRVAGIWCAIGLGSLIIGAALLVTL
jgi:hypothetical protein